MAQIEKIKRPQPEPEIIIDGIIYKKCMGNCGQLKELTVENFKWRPDSKKWRNMCRVCINFNDNQPRKENYKNVDKIINNIIFRTCVDCFEDKELNEDNFYFFDHSINFNYDCKKCFIKKTKEYYKKNIYYGPKQQKIKTYDRNAHRRKKYKEEPNYKLRSKISNSINVMLKQNKSNKNGESVLNYLNYTINELKIHLEKQFEPWMNWNNWGSYNSKTWNDNDKSTWVWNLDHIIPQSKLPYDSMDHQNFKKCWCLQNLRPYNAKLNVIEQDRKNVI